MIRNLCNPRLGARHVCRAIDGPTGSGQGFEFVGLGAPEIGSLTRQINAGAMREHKKTRLVRLRLDRAGLPSVEGAGKPNTANVGPEHRTRSDVIVLYLSGMAKVELRLQ